jgi:biopolymer transport protein ExbD
MIFDEELKQSPSINFAPMIDFLFLMLALFATLAVSRASLFDKEIDLVKGKNENVTKQSSLQTIHLSIDSSGKYKWITEFQTYPMNSLEDIQLELERQYQIGSLPQDKNQTEILLHIDENAPWAPIAKALFAIREKGFHGRPVYEQN